MRNLKKVLSLVLCVAVMLSVMVVGAGAAFSDQGKIQNAEAVDACVALNIINGYDDGTYRPESNVTRAEAAKMICIALNGGKEPTLSVPATPTFTDVRTDKNSSWAEKYIEACVAQGIVAGLGDGRFNPSGNVTGSELAKMLLVALGYRADEAKFYGNNWATNVNVVATQKGLYEDLESIDVSSALTRDNAAQMIWNALQAVEVKYDYTLVSENGQLVSKVDVVDKANNTNTDNGDNLMSLLEDKYGATVKTGILNTAGHTTKGYTAKVSTIRDELTKLSADPTDLVGKAVKVLYKDKDNVYGIYVDTENTTVAIETTLGDIDTGKSEYKLDGVTYKLPTGDGAPATFGAVKAVTTLGGDSTTLGTVNASAASKVVLIDQNGDEKIDIAVVTPVQFGEITYLNSSNITVKGVLTNQKLEDCDIYSGAAKDDQVAVILGKYVADGDIQIAKLDSVNGKVDGTKTTGEVRVNGTWYDVAGVSADINDSGDFFLYNGYIVAVDTTGASISDTCYVISTSTSMDAYGHYQARVLFAGNSEPQLVSTKTTDISDMYCYYDIDDSVYTFEQIKTGSDLVSDLSKEYDANNVVAYKDGRFYKSNSSGTLSGEALIDDSAVFFVRYAQDDGEYKYAVLTGAEVADWGDVTKTLGTDSSSQATSIILTEKNDSLNRIKGAMIDLGTAKMPASSTSYGVIVSAIAGAADNKIEFTLWTGTEQIDVVTSGKTTDYAKFQVVEYAKNSDGTYDIDAVYTDAAKTKEAGVVKGFDQYSIMDHTSSVVQLANNGNAAENYNITKDTQIIYVDTSADELNQICVNGGTISDAGIAKDADTAANVEYFRNATFVIDEEHDLALLVVLTNTKDAYYGTVKQ